LKRTNGLLREVFAGTHFLMAYLDRDLRYQRVNRAFARANGMDQERFIGRKHFDMFPDGRIETIFKGVLSSREPYVAEDITLRSFGGMEAGSWDMDLLPLKGERAEVEGLVLSLIDRTKRRQAIDELEKSRAEFERLASYLQDLREEERRSIAREIHDELGGLLTSIKMDLALIRKSVSAPGAGFEPAINRAEDLANRSIEIMRRIVYDLRPQILDDLGLIPALEWLVSEMKKRSVVRFFLNIPPTEVQLPKEIATALFRIVQEALTNVVRHANATRVEIALKAGEDAVEVRVSDNGSGITEEQMRRPNAFGLIGIHERVSHFGGNVTIRGLPEKGTTLIVTMPAKRGIT
jgi:signal transduction histidine kinase